MIKQIATMPQLGQFPAKVLALTDKGEIWALTADPSADSKWRKLPPIPDDDASSAHIRLVTALREACQMRYQLCRNGDPDTPERDPLEYDKPLQRWTAAINEVCTWKP